MDSRPADRGPGYRRLQAGIDHPTVRDGRKRVGVPGIAGQPRLADIPPRRAWPGGTTSGRLPARPRATPRPQHQHARRSGRGTISTAPARGASARSAEARRTGPMRDALGFDQAPASTMTEGSTALARFASPRASHQAKFVHHFEGPRLAFERRGRHVLASGRLRVPPGQADHRSQLPGQRRLPRKGAEVVPGREAFPAGPRAARTQGLYGPTTMSPISPAEPCAPPTSWPFITFPPRA